MREGPAAPRGRLLVVATPLGNLGDITARALEALKSADLVACEDTRRTRALLTKFGLRVPTISSHRFNESARAGQMLAMLAEGKTIAVVTDAGTPGVSDPGARLVAAAREQGAEILAIPGPSAPAAAISVSGFDAAGYLFAGFAPPRASARRRFIRSLAAAEEARASALQGSPSWPIVFFEAPHRIAAALDDLLAELGDRRAVVVREMTKLHEETLHGRLSEISRGLRGRAARGEFTVVVEGLSEAKASARPIRPITGSSASLEAAPSLDDPAALGSAYRALLDEGLDRREALRRLAKRTGHTRRDLYRVLFGSGGSGAARDVREEREEEE